VGWVSPVASSPLECLSRLDLVTAYTRGISSRAVTQPLRAAAWNAVPGGQRRHASEVGIAERAPNRPPSYEAGSHHSAARDATHEDRLAPQ
jgi:hypothetical protein